MFYITALFDLSSLKQRFILYIYIVFMYSLCNKIKRSYKAKQNGKSILNLVQEPSLFSGLSLFHNDSSVIYKS